MSKLSIDELKDLAGSVRESIWGQAQNVGREPLSYMKSGKPTLLGVGWIACLYKNN